MPYTPTEWADGDIITAEKLNNAEQGVRGVSSDYAPTTWADGDIITAEKLNNMEQGIVDAFDAQITVEPLSVTENGTITAPTGKAYSPVTVNVQTGGGEEEAMVYFIDYDGEILHSYTATEWAGVSALPANPSHTGLVAQGWNWTKAQIDAQLLDIPDGDVWVGQMYITASGATEIDISVTDGALSPTLSVSTTQGGTINWGDGTSSEIASGSSTKNITHDYSLAGDYTISIFANSGSTIKTGSTSSKPIINYSSASGINYNIKYSSAVKRIRIGENFTITSYAFKQFQCLESITLPNSLVVDSSAQSIFENDYCLRGIVFPAGMSLASKNSLLTQCYNLFVASVPYNCNEFPNAGFRATSIKSITIPSVTTSIGGNCFSGCALLSRCVLPTNISIGSNVFSGCYSLTQINIPQGANLQSGVFQNDYNLDKLVISDGATHSNGSGQIFMSCYGIHEVTIPASFVAVTGSNMFASCVTLERVIIKSGALQILDNMFTSCNRLKSVSIPNTVTTILGSAFSNCWLLENIDIPSSVTDIRGSVFAGCSSLESIELPSGITTISSSLFYNCVSLRSITIPSGVTSIGNNAFQCCYGLASITIPSGVMSIGDNVFQNCYGLSACHLEPTTPPALGATVFTGSSVDLKIYVPYSADHSVLEAYQTATNWSDYASKIVEESE